MRKIRIGNHESAMSVRASAWKSGGAILKIRNMTVPVGGDERVADVKTTLC